MNADAPSYLLVELVDYSGAGNADVIPGLDGLVRLGLELAEQHLPLLQGQREGLSIP